MVDPDRYRPDPCPQCEAKRPLRAPGFYCRTLVDVRFGVSVIAGFLVARLLEGRRWVAAALAATQPHMPYQRGQFWVRRFRGQAEALGAALAAKLTPLPAANFVARALLMLQSLGWVTAHRFRFSQLRVHLLGWPRFLAPHGRPATLPSAGPP